MLRNWKTPNTSHHPAIESTNDGQNLSSGIVFMKGPAHFGKPLPARLATAPAMHSGTDCHTTAENTPAQTHTLLMTRHPNHPNRSTNDRHTPNQHTIGTQQHVRACTDMQERFQHSHPCKPLSWLQQTTARPSRHSPGMHSGTGSHTPAESGPATNSHPAHDATPKPPQQTNK